MDLHQAAAAPPSPLHPWEAFPITLARVKPERKVSFCFTGQVFPPTELAQGWDGDNGLQEQLGLLWDCWSECFGGLYG